MRSALAVLILVATMATTPASGEEAVRLFAASSLTDVLSEIVSDFESGHDVRVIVQYGGSSALTRQILAGAPADLFFSADTRQLGRVIDAGLIVEEDTAEVLSNQLVVVVPRSATASFQNIRQLAGVERLAIADPAAVPAGVYARQYLERQGVWSTLQRKVVPTLDVRAALAAVASGNISAGIVYRTDARVDDRVKVALAIPPEDGPRIRYALGVLSASDRHAVRALCDYLQSASASDVFERHGFLSLERAR